jgi:hypothetical protein
MFEFLKKLLRLGRKGSSAVDEAAEAAVVAERMAELGRARTAALNVITHTNAGHSLTLKMSGQVNRLRALLPQPSQGNVIAFRSRVNFSEILDTSNELLGAAERALNAAKISADKAREALSKNRVISIQRASAENLSATKAAEKASRAADEYVSMLDQSKTRLDQLHQELRALTNPTGKDLPEVRRIVETIGDEVAGLERKSAEVVALAKEAEVSSRGMTLPPGVRPNDLANHDTRTEDEKFRDWVDENDPLFGPIVPRKERDAWVEPTVNAVLGAYQKFDSAMRSMAAGDDGQGNYKLKAPVPMCFPQRPQVCEDPIPVKAPENGNAGVWNKAEDPSQSISAVPAGAVVKP